MYKNTSQIFFVIETKSAGGHGTYEISKVAAWQNKYVSLNFRQRCCSHVMAAKLEMFVISQIYDEMTEIWGDKMDIFVMLSLINCILFAIGFVKIEPNSIQMLTSDAISKFLPW